MPRLIDADKLAKDINGLSTHLLNEWDTMGVLMQIDEQPTVDAEPVIRCKNCRYRNANNECRMVMLEVKDNDFCCWGERREDAKND